jgi:hypothetical protein
VLHVETHDTWFGLNASSSAEVATLRVNIGMHNDDGSNGLNAGAMATLVGVEGTVEHAGWSATVGISVSAGAAFSMGEGPDVNGDGVPQRCFKGSFMVGTLGVCTDF